MGNGLGGRFRTLWLAATISFVGDGVALVAFPLLAVELTDSALLVAGTQVARGIPGLLFGVFAGVVADRYDRRRIMFGVDIVRALVVAALAVFVALDAAPIALVFVVVFVLASGESLFDPAATAVLPNVVAVNDLDRANGRMVASESSAQELVGPALGAMLFALAAWTPFALDAVSFAVAALLIWTLPGSFRGSNASPESAASSVRDDLVAGWNFLRRNSVLCALAVFGSLQNFAAAAVEATLVLYALHVLHTGNVGFGVLVAIAAIGGVIGALTTDRIATRVGGGTVLVASHLIAGVATLVVAVASDAFVAAPALVVVFACMASSQVVGFSLRQELTPDALRGRVQSLFRTALWATWPIGALVGGLLAGWSYRAPMMLFAIVIFGLGVIATPLVGNRAIARARAVAHA